MMENIEKAIELKKELDELRPLAPQQEAIVMQKFRLDWNYHSNHLEGNSLTFGETKALILHGITAQGKPLKDHFEITGHNEAVNWVLDIVKGDYELSEKFIRELHLLLLKETHKVDAITPEGSPTKKIVNVGSYKTTPNHVMTQTGEIFRFATPEETPALMHDLLNWYKEKVSSADFNPILIAAEFHYKFIRIHPFDDGNGRTARIIMNFILMKFGYPPVIIKTEDKNNYIHALQQADGGMIEPFIDYIAGNLVNSLQIMIAGAKGESINEPDDLDKEIALIEQRLKSLGEKAHMIASREVLNNLYKDSIRRLYDQFITSCKKFDRFYLKAKLSLASNIVTIENNNSSFDILFTHIQRYPKLLTSLKLNYTHNTFTQIGFGEFSHHTRISFTFRMTEFSVVTDTTRITKKYTDQLSEKEISNLITVASAEHKRFIEEKIQQMENKINKS